MEEVIELRKKPELKITLKEKEFEIVDSYEIKNSGVYQFEELRSIHLNKEKVNRFISTLSIIIDFLTASAVGGKFSDKASLILDMKSQKIKIWLIEADFNKAKSVTELLKNKVCSK